MKASRKIPARRNDRLPRCAAASLAAGPDRRSSRHGAPSTISAGPAIANALNWIDSAKT